MEKRGFTLIELIATLIVLSIVALVVVPELYESVKEIREGITVTQLQGIIDSTKDWAVTNIDELPSEDGKVTYVFLKDLQAGGYIDYDIYKDNDGNKYNDNIFVLIECEVIEANEWNNQNYKYKYTIYETNEKHLEYLASLYAIKNNVTSTTTVTLSDLIPYANEELVVSNKLKNIEDGSLISNVSITIRYINGNYTYSITM